MSKIVIGKIKLEILPGKANPAPPVGPALGQKGLNIMDFCKQFNDATKSKDPNFKIPVVITAYANKSFDFIMKEPPTSSLIMKEVGLKSGAKMPGRDVVGKITKQSVENIAKIKMAEMGCYDVESASKIVCGTAYSMGVEVVNE